MAEPLKKTAKIGESKIFKYPSEEECLVRRLGSAVLSVWPALPAEIREKILAEATTVWDREYNVAQLPQKLDAFIKRHPSRLA
jgi:hypothetical protein